MRYVQGVGVTVKGCMRVQMMAGYWLLNSQIVFPQDPDTVIARVVCEPLLVCYYGLLCLQMFNLESARHGFE